MILHPVILPLLPENHALRGRELVLAQRRRAREALALSCEAGGIRLGPLMKDARDAPIPFNGIYWSLSHKPRFVAAVAGSDPVGIDIEEVISRKDGIHAYVAADEEWALADREWETLFRYWTAKEAVLKAVGVGMTELKKTRIHAVPDRDTLIVDYDSRLWPVRHFRVADHLVSVTCGNHDVAWHCPEGVASTAGRS